MSFSTSQVVVASSVAIAAAATGAAMLAVGASSQQTASDSSGGGSSGGGGGGGGGSGEKFPRYTPETERETLESLRLDWEPPSGKQLLLRQTRGDAAKAIYEEALSRNRAQGAKDAVKRKQRTDAVVAKLAKFKSHEVLQAEQQGQAATSGGHHPGRLSCSVCYEPIRGKYFSQHRPAPKAGEEHGRSLGLATKNHNASVYNICSKCSDSCFACESKLGNKVFTLPLSVINKSSAPSVDSPGVGDSADETSSQPAPEALLCNDCTHFLQQRSCALCNRICGVMYGDKCHDCSANVCVGCKEFVTSRRVITRSADHEDFNEHWCEKCFARAQAADLKCHCCRRFDFTLHGEIALRPLHQSALEVCPTGDYAPGEMHRRGRLVCCDCSHPDQQPVVTSEQARTLWKDSVLPYFAAKGLAIPNDLLEQLPILLVDSSEMDRLARHDPHHCPSENTSQGAGAGKRGTSGKDQHAELTRRPIVGTSVLGLTLSKTTTHVVHTVNRQNGKYVHEDQDMSVLCKANSGGAKAMSGTVTETHTHQVDAIALLYGLPLVAAGEVLAHEFVHAFHVLYERRASPSDPSKAMSKAVSEGTAQLGAYHWLADCVKNPRFLNLQRMRLRNIETHSDPDYGQGFLDARASFDRITSSPWLLGWFRSGAPFSKIFQHTAETGQLP